MDFTAIGQCIKEEFSDFERRYSDCLPQGEDTLGLLADYVLNQKGKRLRPLISLLIAKTCGGVTDATFRAAIILELLHTASLVHDDVLDESDLRRGQPTVNSKWDNRTAILFGDYIYGRCLHLIETKEDFELLGIYSKIAMELPQGEFLQKDVSVSQNCSQEAYFEIIDRKTASLFGAAAYVGAKTAKGGKDYSKGAEKFGRLLGRAFQIKDDILDLKINSNSGKGYGNDIKEKKITLPVIFLLDSLSEGEKRRLLEFIARDEKTERQIRELIEALHGTDCLQKSDDVVKRYSKMAVEQLQTLPENDYRIKLGELTESLISRNV